MDAELVFGVLNLAVLPWWAVWIVAPKSRWAKRAASHGAVFVALFVVYAIALAMVVVGDPPAGADPEAGPFAFDNVRLLLATPVGFLAGWTHFIAFDLFVGAWVVREALRIDVDPRVFLFFTLMAGPIGLGTFLIRRAWRVRTIGQIGESDLV